MSETTPKHVELKDVRSTVPRLVGPAVLNEIRNPLTNIVLSLDLLELEDVGTDPKIYFDIIRRNVVRVNTLLSSLLDHGVRLEVQDE